MQKPYHAFLFCTRLYFFILPFILGSKSSIRCFISFNVRQRKENTEEQFMTRLFTDQLETGIIIHDYDHVRPTTQLSPVIFNYDDNRKNHCDKNYFDI